MEDNLDARLAAEVTQLSTRLVTEVAKLLQLEETILQLRKESARLNGRIGELRADKNAAEEKNKQLEGEVEDLTASLFNEANEMVSNASRETYNFKMKNRKLIEELSEKDTIIESLQDQLKDLKLMFLKLEDQQRALRANTPRMDHQFDFQKGPIETEEELLLLLLQIYGPCVRALRFDTSAYQEDFKGFIYQLIKPDFQFDLASLKNLKYFRKIWVEEIEPCVEHIPLLSGNFMNRWSKGKTFWGLLVEGRAIIEPVSGVNETFKLTYKGAKTGDEIPVAIKDPCVFCGECKDDMLEHARLYNLKLYGPASETGGAGNTREIAGEAHEVIGTHPLCNFCLVKLRTICDFFAKLRMIHGNIYKLKQNSSYDDIAFVLNFQFKRAEGSVHGLDPLDEPAVLKLYIMLLVIRAKLFWSKIGIWDTEEDVQTISLDEINIDVFRKVIRDNVAFKHFQSQQVLDDHQVAMKTSAEYDREIGVTREPDSDNKVETINATSDKGAIEEDFTEKDNSEDEEFADTSEMLDIEGDKEVKEEKEVSQEKEEEKDLKEEKVVEKVVNGEAENQDVVEDTKKSSLKRKKGRKGKGKKTIEQDLDLTMEMLKESL